RALREQSYLATRATYTRRAFGVDVMPRADSTMQFASIAAALPAISVWDVPALSRATDAARVSGDDRTVPIGWRVANGALVADVIGAPPAGAGVRSPWTSARIIASDADERGAPVRADPADDPTLDDAPVEAPVVYPGADYMALAPDSLRRIAGTPLESDVART